MERKKKSVSGASQRACLFKIDNELLPWLRMQPNKGRYINELIKRDMQAGAGDYAAAVEAEKQRQNTAAQEVDAEYTMQQFCQLKQTYPPTVCLWKRENNELLDALFEDARTVKRLLPDARITTAEASGIKIDGCLLTRIHKEDVKLLKQAGLTVLFVSYQYIKTENTGGASCQ